MTYDVMVMGRWEPWAGPIPIPIPIRVTCAKIKRCKNNLKLKGKEV
jgi:hypothetical protein